MDRTLTSSVSSSASLSFHRCGALWRSDGLVARAAAGLIVAIKFPLIILHNPETRC
jgi:hypothetical protein